METADEDLRPDPSLGVARIVVADLTRPDHEEAVVALTQAYACDPMGNGAPLPAEVMRELVPGLRRHPTTRVWLAFVGDEPVGIATCFVGFSTFYARPLINVHDLGVVPSCRGRGIGRQLLGAVEQHARKAGHCKVTLEVQEGNARARRIYERVGFRQAAYASEIGGALFFVKRLL